jgi:hypothetical protein
MNRPPQLLRISRPRRAVGRNNPGLMKTGMVGIATTLLAWGGLGLTAPNAQAAPRCPGGTCMQWCPGDPDPAGGPIPWDRGACHDFWWDQKGLHDAGTGQFYAWSALPFK